MKKLLFIAGLLSVLSAQAWAAEKQYQCSEKFRSCETNCPASENSNDVICLMRCWDEKTHCLQVANDNVPKRSVSVEPYSVTFTVHFF